jgi:uncharacterized protein
LIQSFLLSPIRHFREVDTSGRDFQQEDLMQISFARITGLVVAMLLLIAPAHAQSTSPDAETAARELIDTMKLPDQFKELLPAIIQQLKPAIVQDRADVARDFDAMMPMVQQKMGTRLGELSNAIAAIYADNFTADELRALTAFYKSPAGQKFLQKTPVIAAQTMAAGQKFGQAAAADAQKQMTDELRSKGHHL